MKQQIVAMGGGGFSAGSETLLLERFIISLTGKPRPRVSFIPTASGDADSYLLKFYRAFARVTADISHLPLFELKIKNLRDYLLEQDVIYVGGGNTRNMLLLWRDRGLDSVLREAWGNGIVLCGTSAGSIRWFAQGLSDSVVAGELRPMNCLGFLEGSNCPHYDGESQRRPCYHRFIRQQSLAPGYAADDGVGLHFVGSTLRQVVGEKPEASAYAVSLDGDRGHEERLKPRVLG
jgi:peptidase E